ncbi:MAG: hypothetical protein ABSD31_18980 [Candidatus Binataceae bacterium]|jgi:hypothetical protein
MRRALLVVIVATALSLWIGGSAPAYAKTLACEGAQSGGGATATEFLPRLPSSPTGLVKAKWPGPSTGILFHDWLLPADGVLGQGGNVALWSVTIVGSNFTGGSLTANTLVPPVSVPVATCFYTLDPTSSSTSSGGGNTLQTLVWDAVSSNPGDCAGTFTDQVNLIAKGAAAVMIDNNLAGQKVPGAGTCIQK